MPAGVKVSIVVCPFLEEYYLFEEGKENYKTYSLKEVFTHPNLPELELNFREILQESLKE
ncbi:MAG: hypothetical protein N3A69_10135 [Leptospiraceae bacterium]|nr:hypothetical protein [Leptospiraceae bacterium]